MKLYNPKSTKISCFFTRKNSVLRSTIYNRADNHDHGQTFNNDEINVAHNPIFLHQNQNINNEVDAIFPAVIPGFRNVTALCTFQKNQRDVFKAYQLEQIRIFIP